MVALTNPKYGNSVDHMCWLTVVMRIVWRCGYVDDTPQASHVGAHLHMSLGIVPCHQAVTIPLFVAHEHVSPEARIHADKTGR